MTPIHNNKKRVIWWCYWHDLVFLAAHWLGRPSIIIFLQLPNFLFKVFHTHVSPQQCGGLDKDETKYFWLETKKPKITLNSRAARQKSAGESDKDEESCWKWWWKSIKPSTQGSSSWCCFVFTEICFLLLWVTFRCSLRWSSPLMSLFVRLSAFKCAHLASFYFPKSLLCPPRLFCWCSSLIDVIYHDYWGLHSITHLNYPIKHCWAS